MSLWSRYRPLPLIAGAVITIVLALWLLPKPETTPGDIGEPTVAIRDGRVEAVRPAPVQPILDDVITPDPAPEPIEVVTPSTRPLGTPEAPFPVSSKGFRMAMSAHNGAITACFDRWAAGQTDLPDRQVVRFYIEPDEDSSYLDRVEVMDSVVDNTPMEDCVHDLLADLVFEPSETMTVYTFPFRFGEVPDK